jgi:Protein of unknown function (DUF2442)
MAAGRDLTTEADIEAAMERARNEPPLPQALSAEYNRELDVVVIKLDNKRRLVIPREEMQGLEDASETQLAQIEIFGGLDIAWPQLDVDHYLPYLLDGNYATESWKQSRQRETVAA